MTLPAKNEQLVAVTSAMSDEDFREMATSAKYLPRIQLFGSSATLVKMGQFPIGHYGLVTAKDKVEDLGEEFDCLPLQVRSKAMDTNGDMPVSVFQKDSEEFKDIKARSVGVNTKCMWGPEFLLWLPGQERFATMFFCNPTMRRESPNMKELLGYPVTCKVQWIPSKQYGGWHGPIVLSCSTPFPVPSTEDIEEQVTLFLNPPVRMVEKAAAGMDRDR